MKKAYYQFQNLIDKHVPLSPFVRWFIIAGILLRFYIGLNQYSTATRIIWLISVFVFSIYSLVATVITFYQYKHPEHLVKNTWYLFQIIVDTVAFTIFYVLTGRSNSDFYL